MADVAVENEVPSVIVVATTNGQVAFDYDFRADFVEDLKAQLRPLSGAVVDFVGGVDFIASGLGTAAGGTIALTSFTGTMAGDSLAIYRDIPIARPNDYSRDLFTEDLNAEQDRIFMIMQELQRDIDRAVKSEIGSDPIDITVGASGQMVAFNDAGDLIPIDPPSGTGNMNTAIYDPGGIGGDIFDKAKHKSFLTTDIAAKIIPAAVMSFDTAGYSAHGKGGATFKRIAAPAPVRLWHKQSADGAWFSISVPEVHSDMLGAIADDLTDTQNEMQAAADLAEVLGVKCVINKGLYNVPNFDCPDHSIVEWEPGAWFRPRTHSNVGAIISNVNGPNLAFPRLKARTDITLINPQVDGIHLPFVGTVMANDNGVGFATGVSKIRVIGGHIKRMIANFQNGPGGKGVGFEEGVNDVIVWGTRIEDCTYATFVSPTLSDPAKYCWNIEFHDLIIERCAAVAWLLSDESTPGALPTPDPTHCSASYFGIVAKDVGHFPDRPIATYRAKTGAILLQGFSNLVFRGRIINSPNYPSVGAPAGGTAFPTGYPAPGTTFFGAGLSGPPGAPLWGFGRNINIDLDCIGAFDDVWMIQRCRAHAGDAFGGVIAPVGASGNVIKIVMRGAVDGLINSGVVGASGTLTAATINSVTFPNLPNIATRDNVYAGVTITITGGTGSGQSRVMSNYNATTRVAQVDTNWTVTPDATSTFNLGSTLAVADGNITGQVEIFSDTPAKELVNTLARFPTGLLLKAINPTGVEIKASLLDVNAFNNSYAAGSTTRGNTYTPVLTNVLNITSSTAFLTKYLRVDKVVQVTGLVTFTATAGGACELDIDLPFASNLSTSSQAIGVCSDNAGQSGAVISNTVNKRAKLQYTAGGPGLKTVPFTFMYEIT